VSTGEKYVAAAYAVVFLAVLLWVVLISAKLSRLERELAELTELARRRRAESGNREVTRVG
jgi:CcmD family protein